MTERRFLKDRYLDRAGSLRDRSIPRVPGRGLAADLWNRLAEAHGDLLPWLCREAEIEPAAAVAVLLVESSGSGFARSPPNTSTKWRLLIRFEIHQFLKRASARTDAPLLFRCNLKRPWTGHAFLSASGTWIKVHRSQTSEYEAMEAALALGGIDKQIVYQSISMGLAQIMGFNHAMVGYGRAEGMYDAFRGVPPPLAPWSLRERPFHLRGEMLQLCGLFDFIESADATRFLRRHLWEQFAEVYNGFGNVHVYAPRLAEAYAKASAALGGGHA